MILSLLASLLSCKCAPDVPAEPGTSVELTYPVLLIHSQQKTFRVRNNVTDLTTTNMVQMGSGDFENLQIVDSGGALYQVTKATPVGKARPWFLDMGTTPFRFRMELKPLRKVTLEETKRIVLGVVSQPDSYWGRDSDKSRAAVEKVQSAGTLAELIELCREPYNW